MPPSLHEFVPPGHMAHFVRDTVREGLDLSATIDSYAEERGDPPWQTVDAIGALAHGGLLIAQLPRRQILCAYRMSAEPSRG